MLVITRKVNDSLIIEMEGKDQTIEIKVTEIGNQVRLAIDAPPGCKIWRKELYQTIQANRQAAVAQAEAIIDAGVQSFVHWLGQRD